MDLRLFQIHFCAAECSRQKSGEISVSDMCNAYHFALNNAPSVLDADFVLHLGKLIEPIQNRNGFRVVPAYFEDMTNQALRPELIHRAMDTFMRYGQYPHAIESYTAFQKIHPFTDGNGRVGAILYNIWNGTMNHPATPPDVFKK